jgi:predicted phage terminase large subunit-like protein
MSFTKSKAAVIAMTARYPQARRKLIEDKANGPAIMDSLKAEISGMIPVEPDGSKIARAHAITAEWEAGNIWLPHPDIAPWIKDWIDEITTFPAAANDDRVDAFTQAVRDLYSASKGLWG